MSNKTRIEKIEERLGSDEELIEEIIVSVINLDGTVKETFICKEGRFECQTKHD